MIRLIFRLTITAIILMAVGVAVYTYLVVFWPIQKLHRCFAFPGEDGVTFVEPDGRGVKRALQSTDGKPLEYPIFAVHDSRLFYWSRPDSSLGVVSGSSKEPKWYPVTRDTSRPDLRVRRISTDGRFVAMDIGSRLDKESALFLDLQNGRWERLPDATQIRLDPSGSGQVVVYTLQGKFVARNINGGKNPRIISQIPYVWDWDYAFDTKTLYILKSGLEHICVQDSSGLIKQVKLPMGWNGLAVFWQPEYKELWVPGHGVFSVLKVPVLSGAGRYIGVLPPFGPPFYVQGMDCKDMRLIRNSLGVVRD